MTEHWPQTDLDSVRRMRALASAVSGAAVTERVIDASLADVWGLMADLTGTFTEIQPDLRSVEIVAQDGDRVVLLARSKYRFRARLEGVVRPGWCWLQSRFLVIGMAAAEEAGGRTRVALTGGVRVPGRAAIVPLGVRRESRKTLDRLTALAVGGSHP
jgi:hypothetical protein